MSWDQRVGSTSTDMKRGTFLGKVKNIKDQSPPYGFFLRKCDGREIHIFHSANFIISKILECMREHVTNGCHVLFLLLPFSKCKALGTRL